MRLGNERLSYVHFQPDSHVCCGSYGWAHRGGCLHRAAPATFSAQCQRRPDFSMPALRLRLYRRPGCGPLALRAMRSVERGDRVLMFSRVVAAEVTRLQYFGSLRKHQKIGASSPRLLLSRRFTAFPRQPCHCARCKSVCRACARFSVPRDENGVGRGLPCLQDHLSWPWLSLFSFAFFN